MLKANLPGGLPAKANAEVILAVKCLVLGGESTPCIGLLRCRMQKKGAASKYKKGDGLVHW